MKNSAALFVLLLAGCAATQEVTLLPRGGAGKGFGELDRMTNQLTVDLNGTTYHGPMIMRSAQTASFKPLEAAALMMGDGGQVRCEITFNALMTEGNGVCVDSRNATYDLLIK